MTGMGKAEKVLPVEDAAHDQEQIQHRLTVFQDSWPRLEKWFTKYGLLKSVDAIEGADTVYLEVEKILEDTLEKVITRIVCIPHNIKNLLEIPLNSDSSSATNFHEFNQSIIYFCITIFPNISSYLCSLKAKRKRKRL